jgi:CheY-like chemotaxis protein
MARIMVVEDEALTGMMLAAAIEDAGHEVVGPFASLAPALQAIEHGDMSGAILDINLGRGVTSYPVARALLQAGIRFVFLTGYAREGIDPAFAAVPFFRKPLGEPHLRTMIATLAR